MFDFYTGNEVLIGLAFIPFIVMLSNFFIAVPAFVFMNAVAGFGNTKRTFFFQIVTIIFYLLYLGLLNKIEGTPLAVYCTVEHLFVGVLLVLSMGDLRKRGVW